jgi:hypothetical protein
MKTFLLIMTMSGSYGGGVATATFDNLKSCEQAGAEFVAMSKALPIVHKFICVEN